MQVDDDKSYDDINVTPMVDLYLVLLLIFIIMTTSVVKGIKVKLPRASSTPAAPNPNAPKLQAIVVTGQGKILLNRHEVTLPELESGLTAMKARTPDFPVVLRGDNLTEYKGILEVLDMLNRIGVKQVGLTTPAPQ